MRHLGKQGPSNMTKLTQSIYALSLAGVIVLANSSVFADERKAPVNAITGSGWSSEVNAAKGGITVSDAQLKTLKRINVYMNSFKNLEGRFRQTNPNKEKQKGKFFVQRPGKMRFDYASPSLLMIISDGENLSIEDHDLKTVDRYPLESTPFRMLLADNVDILRDAIVLGIKEADGKVSVSLADKTGNSAGQISLVFADAGGKLDLLEWIIRDAQGLDTKIEVGNMTMNKEVDGALFKPSNLGLATVFDKG